MNKENCVLKLVDEIILDYDARSKKLQNETSVSLRLLLTESQPSVTGVNTLTEKKI